MVEYNIVTNYIYLLQEREFIKTNENIFKLGMTKRENNKRFNQYPKGSILLFQLICQNVNLLEKEIIKEYKTKFIQRKDIGNEYFEGNFEDMISLMYSIRNKYVINNFVTATLKREQKTQEEMKKEQDIQKKKEEKYQKKQQKELEKQEKQQRKLKERQQKELERHTKEEETHIDKENYQTELARQQKTEEEQNRYLELKNKLLGKNNKIINLITNKDIGNILVSTIFKEILNI
jgi:flagellar biosynthesis GTPase FlhF